MNRELEELRKLRALLGMPESPVVPQLWALSPDTAELMTRYYESLAPDESRSEQIESAPDQFDDNPDTAIAGEPERFANRGRRDAAGAGSEADRAYALLARSRAGNAGAFAQVLEEQQPWLTRAAHRSLKGFDDPAYDADDLTADVLRRVLVARESFAGTGLSELRAWLQQILDNTVHELSRRARPHEKTIPQDMLDDAGVRPRESEREEHVSLEAVLEGLPANDADVIRAVHLQGTSLSDHAATRGISYEAAKKRLQRARKRLANLLREPKGREADKPDKHDESDGLEDRLKKLIVDALALEDVDPASIETDAPLFGDGLGLDSIDALELALAIHSDMGVRTEENDERNAEYYYSVRSLADFIRSKLAGRSLGAEYGA